MKRGSGPGMGAAGIEGRRASGWGARRICGDGIMAERREGGLADALDINLPDGFHLKVHEDSATNAHLVLPPDPKLTEEDLRQVAGGSCKDWMSR